MIHAKREVGSVAASALPLALLLAVALGLRLLVWRWREFYPLGGDEQEYLNAALTLLRERRYVELQFMRPPVYELFLAGSIYVFDSLVQNLRLVQALISAFTVVPIYALTWELFHSRRVALVAGLLFALNYTLAASATELLSETVFLFGLSVALWLIVRAGQGSAEQRTTGNRRRTIDAALAGLTLGALALTRSVALPLVGLAALWLLVQKQEVSGGENEKRTKTFVRRLVLPSVLVGCTLLIILPWTARNFVTYGAPILIDTTGAENLWLDNNASAATPADLLGREAAKRELYALGDDRAARQTLASRRGVEEITGNGGWFAQKVWGEAKKFFALQHFDELREKRAIWVPPTAIWAKILLGDGLWLVLLFGGSIGFTISDLRFTKEELGPGIQNPKSKIQNPVLLFILWCFYILATSLLFHVELRYRLPLYPALAPFAAFGLVRLAAWKRIGKPAPGTGRSAIALLAVGAIATITLLHRPYLSQSWMLANKHAALGRAERALSRGDAATAQQAASAALARDDSSALARVALARAALLRGDRASAESQLDAAIVALAAHPQAHLLRGALLRADGDLDAARTAFANEVGSLQDLQSWSWPVFAPFAPPPAALDVGAGLDLGFVRGFYPAEPGGFRWTTGEAHLQLTPPPGTTTLELELASGRPAGAPAPTLVVLDGATEIGRLTLREGWQTYTLPLHSAGGISEITLRAPTFRPRTFDPASADGRNLGVMVRRVEARQ